MDVDVDATSAIIARAWVACRYYVDTRTSSMIFISNLRGPYLWTRDDDMFVSNNRQAFLLSVEDSDSAQEQGLCDPQLVKFRMAPTRFDVDVHASDAGSCANGGFPDCQCHFTSSSCLFPSLVGDHRKIETGMVIWFP